MPRWADTGGVLSATVASAAGPRRACYRSCRTVQAIRPAGLLPGGNILLHVPRPPSPPLSLSLSVSLSLSLSLSHFLPPFPVLLPWLSCLVPVTVRCRVQGRLPSEPRIEQLNKAAVRLRPTASPSVSAVGLGHGGHPAQPRLHGLGCRPVELAAGAGLL